MTPHLSRFGLPRLLRLFHLLVVMSFGVAAAPAVAQVKIGFQAPLTGFAATDGASAKIAAEMAVDKINAGGGVLGQKVELVTYDDQAKTEEAVFTANKLIGQDGVKFAVSGSYSASGRAAAPIFQQAGVPFISAYGVHPDITRAGNYVFRTVHLGPPQGRAAGKFIADNLHLKKVSIVTMDNDYGQATLEGFKSVIGQFGLQVAGEYSYSLKDRQFGPDRCQRQARQSRRDLYYRIFLHRRTAGESASFGRHHGTHRRLPSLRCAKADGDRRPGR